MTDFEKILIRVQYVDLLLVYDNRDKALYYYRRFIDKCRQNYLIYQACDLTREIKIGDHVVKFTGDMVARKIKNYKGEVLYNQYF